ISWNQFAGFYSVSHNRAQASSLPLFGSACCSIDLRRAYKKADSKEPVRKIPRRAFALPATRAQDSTEMEDILRQRVRGRDGRSMPLDAVRANLLGCWAYGSTDKLSGLDLEIGSRWLF